MAVNWMSCAPAVTWCSRHDTVRLLVLTFCDTPRTVTAVALIGAWVV
jgi:hypothetical protein